MEGVGGRAYGGVVCGRYVTPRVEDIERVFELDEVGEDLPEQAFNVAPTDRIPVIVESPAREAKGDRPAQPQRRRLEAAHWGLLPGYARERSAGSRLFNARVESVLEKPAFRSSAKGRRALIPALGYYEWTKDRRPKVPFYMHPHGVPQGGAGPDAVGALLAFAGLYAWWADPAKADDDPHRWVLSATIITRPSAGHLAGLHDRMPLMLPATLWRRWVDPNEPATPALLDEALRAGEQVANSLDMVEVDRAVGNVKNQGPQLLEPVAGGIVIAGD